VADVDELRSRFRADAADHRSRAPFHASLCEVAATDPEIAGLLRHAPAEQRLPVLLMAAVHSIVLAEPHLEIARHYPTHAGHDAPGGPATAHVAELFRSFCHDRAEEIARIVAGRRTQTNEVGRAALFLPALALLDAEHGPLGLVDVGTSGGLNLQLDRFEYRYRPGGRLGGPATVRLTCDVTGPVPVPTAIPTISSRIGVDSAPIDVSDPDEARWLKACVWPDQADRFERLSAAIDLAVAHPPVIRREDATTALEAAVDDSDGHPVVMNSWVLNYLSPTEREGYVAELDRLGRRSDLSWVHAECPAMCSGVPFAGPDDERHLTAVTLVTWRSGERAVRHLGSAHPHGYWLRTR
jgi:hypothetical protein